MKKLILLFIAITHLQISYASSSEYDNAVNKFINVFQQIESKYVKEISDVELLEKATKSIVSELDPHSTYFTKKAYEDFQTDMSGEFAGVGIVVSKKGDYVEVVSPIDDTPAYRAGLITGDKITKIDGMLMKGKNIEENISLMKGTPGTLVELTILRNDETLVKKITRAIITVKSVKSEILDDIGYVKISSFDANTAELLTVVLEGFSTASVKNIVLDLRNNPGGYLNTAVKVSDMFMEKDKLIVSTKGRLTNDEYYSKNNKAITGSKVIVLMNSGSASASEVVAGALQDSNNGLVLGEKSFGKGSVQSTFELKDGSAIKFTTALYYTPLGRSIQAKGIVPDFDISGLSYSDKAQDKKGDYENDIPVNLDF